MNEEQLLKYITASVSAINDQVQDAGDLQQDDEASVLIESIIQILEQMDIDINTVIPELLLKAYFGGIDQATAMLIDEGMDIEKVAALTASGKVAAPFQKKVHLDAVNELVSDTLSDFQAAIRTAKGSAKDNIEDTLKEVKKDITNGLIVGDARKVIQQRVAKSFEKGGLTSFVTKDGKKLPLDFYAMTVTRAKTREATTQGSVNRYKENKVTLVQVNERSDTCEVCARFKDMVIDLTGDNPGFKSIKDKGVKLPPYHPNCQGTVRPFVLAFKTEEQIQKEKGKWKSFNPEKDPRSITAKKQYERNQKIRQQANAEKKEYAKWKAMFGDEAPKTIGSFRRMKRANSTNYQHLEKRFEKENVLSSQRERINSGYYPKTISKGKQNKHIEGTNEYKMHMLKLGERGSKPSILTEDPEKLVNQYSGTGRIIASSLRNPPKEAITAGKIIGQYFDPGSMEYVDTRAFMIVYSNNGVHLYPKKEDEY
ncbi:phage minor capsid protein [Virgibacillus sp. 7505]|uniref:phage minor capsid protein n=1 Tax=Virgibacillus sp. 7505 TaxID=2022548 RepID=UPI00159527D1|nr:phage minor capsid protein [Virgibacillus sp. 7505]